MPTPNLPPENPKDSPRYIAGQALKFGGLMIAVAGALALIRTGERSLFFAGLMPVGLITWFIGFRVMQKIEDEANRQTPQQNGPTTPQ